MRIPVVQGRDFDERDRDGAPCVAVVNEAFGRRYFSSGAALGRHLARFAADRSHDKQLCEIVGVVRDTSWQSLQRDARPFYWLPLYQTSQRRMSVLVHTAGDPALRIGEVRRAVQSVDPRVPVSDVQTLGEYFGASAYPFRLIGLVLSACGVVALLLAAVGVYGVVSYSAAQRTREVGIRIALGAVRRQLVQMLVGQGMALVACGLAIGLLLSLALTRVLTSAILDTELLFGVTATDPPTFTGVTILLAVVALLACGVPALRATNVDPVETLRAE
jgi:putative ABC transport system permease protein